MKTFLSIFNALPAILQSVQAVETAIPLPKAGQQKLNLILGVAGAAWDFGQAEIQLPKDKTLAVVQTIANLAVAGFNTAGIFKQSVPVLSK
jgi:hypothetical protein